MNKICSICNLPLDSFCPHCGSTDISFHREGDGGYYCAACGLSEERLLEEEGKTFQSCGCDKPTITMGLKNQEYKIQDGCWNCKHCYVYSRQDDPNMYYCNAKEISRPLDDLEAYKACFDDDKFGGSEADKRYGECLDIWFSWLGEVEEVRAWGICSKWSEK